MNSFWHADEELKDISTRRPIAIKPALSPGVSLHQSSLQELSKFNLVPLSRMHFSNSHHAEASSSLANVHQPIHHDHGLKFGTIQLSNNDKAPVTASTCRKQLMAQYQQKGDLEELVLPSYLVLGKFKCVIRRDYPPTPQCFLASAFKYAPPHSVWPPYSVGPS